MAELRSSIKSWSGRVAFAAVLVIATGTAYASGVWDTRMGTYHEDLADFSDIDYVQAVERDPVADAIRITASWRLEQPASVLGGTGIPFSAAGSATDFASINEEGEYGEEVTLFQKWFGAARNMIWDDICPPRKDVGDIFQCMIFPVPDETAQEDQVLLAPSVIYFNDCHYWEYPGNRCESREGENNRALPYDDPDDDWRGKPDFVELYMHKRSYPDILIPGRFFNVTWWVRSPGQHLAPPHYGESYNRRLVGMRIDFSHTTEGGFPQHNSFLGGATKGNVNQGTSINPCQGNPDIGCPIRVSLHANSDFVNVPRLYMPNWRAWTPFSFNFCLGYMNTFIVPDGDAPINVDCMTCEENDWQGSNYDLCKDQPAGVLGMFLTTEGGSAASNETTAKCPPAGEKEVQLQNCRANASLYIDGMMLTAGEGTYRAPVFDGLSPYTEWTSLYWELEMNPDPPLSANFRTPVSFVWEVAMSHPAALEDGVWDGYAGAHAETGYIELSATSIGRYFRYQSRFISWGNNSLNPPPKPGTRYEETCLRYEPEYDGSLTPALKLAAASYRPFAGQFISELIAPDNLNRWESITYEADSGGGGVVRVDILGANSAPAVTRDGVILTDVGSGASLDRLDPGTYPSLRVRCLLDRQGDFGNQPVMKWFRLKYDPMKKTLSANRNAIHLSRGESADIRFMSRTGGMVEVCIYDMAGQRVLRLFRGEVKGQEIMQRTWRGTGRDGSEVAPGVYFISVVTPTEKQTMRLAIMD